MLQTDHEPLKYMNSAKFANGRLLRWAMFLQSYNFRVEAIKGSENVGADYLSRVQEYLKKHLTASSFGTIYLIFRC